MNENIGFGVQKMTLLDYPGKVACTVFLHGCDFRCPFCHNASLVTRPADADSQVSLADLKAYLGKRRGILDGICVTGGEPLMRENILDLLAEFKGTGLSVKLDTNGSYPERLREAVRRGLVDAVAMDVKNSPEKYDATAGVPGMYEKVAESIDFLKGNPVAYCEFRTTVVRGLHTGDDLVKIAEVLKGAQHYFLQKFVDSGDLIGSGLEAMSDVEMRDCLTKVQAVLPEARLRGI